MNILLITQEDILAGSSFSVSYLAQALALRGHNTYVAARPNSVLHQLVSNISEVTFLPIVIKSRFDRNAMRLVRSWIDIYQIDIINAQSSKDRYITIFNRIFFNVKTPLFHTRRQYPLSSGGFLQRKLYVLGTDKIIVISEELKRIFILKGFPERHLHVIYNGIPVSRYKQWSESEVVSLRKQYGISEGEITIGSVSRLKRQEQLIRSLIYLNKPEIKVILVGIKQGYFDSLCKELGVQNTIIYAGEVSPEKVLNYYKLITINVLASITDGFGLVLLEAMAMGSAVVATRFGGIINVIKNDINGLLFNDGDHQELAYQLNQLITNDNKRAELVQLGLKTAYEDFSMHKTALNYETFFLEQITLAEQSHP
ncbi:MAG: glycosyltransferase family 4 protein [Cyclobacteriaceae bacterium]|nr:glycosyltransferase family 4 protein [Cyclobacteriaceae bacterium]